LRQVIALKKAMELKFFTRLTSSLNKRSV